MDNKKKRKKSAEMVDSSVFDFEPFGNMRNFFPFERMMSPMKGFFATQPRVDVIDEKQRIRIKADMPGVEKDNIKLKVNPGSITISASTKADKEEKGKDYYYRERSASGYYRTLSLPSEVDPNSAKAKFSNGTLEITMTKKDRSNEIEIE